MLSPTYTVKMPSHGVPICLDIWENSPKAVTMLFYPGTMASPHMYPILLQELFRLGCNVAALHPLSHGDSPKVRKAFTLQDILHNGMDAQSWIKAHFQGPLIVSGHSQGGILTLAHAIDNKAIDGIFPICTLLPHLDCAGTVTRWGQREYFLRHKNLFLQALKLGAWLFPAFPVHFLAYLQMGRIAHGAYKVRVGKSSVRNSYPLAFIASLFTANLRAAEEDGRISCPVFLYTAKNDALFPIEMMQKTLDTIKAPTKKLITLHGGGHLCATSLVYAQNIAAHMAATCAGLGFTLHAKQRKNTCNIKD